MKYLSFFYISCLILGCHQYGYKKHRGFCIDFIQHPLASAKDAICDLDPSMLAIFQKPLRYFTCGRQCFVFLSDDQKYVIKFLSSKRFMPRGKLLTHQTQKKALLNSELKSYLLAYQHLKFESGILGFKIGSSSKLPMITLFDPWHRQRTIDLNQAEFIIQPRAKILKSFYDSSFDREKIIPQVENLLNLRLEKNILDHDPRIHRNLGVAQERVIFLDLGSFYEQQELNDHAKQQEMQKILQYNQVYLEKKD